jgi:hypothetical protein
MTYDPASSSIIGTYLIDTLPAPTASMIGKYARVTDLFGEKTDLLLCSNLGTKYYWQPVRPTYAKAVVVTTATPNIPLTPLKSPSVLYITGTLGAGRSMMLSDINAWPGASFEIAMDATLLGTLNIVGTGLGSGVGVLLGSRKRLFYTAEGKWQQFT